MNYRHAFHAGNFADLVKHAALLAMLRELTAGGGPLTVIDTHGGAGMYDLGGEEARRSGEAADGIGRLMADAGAPAELGPLKQAVAGLNPGELRLYPGSPVLAARAIRPGDRLIACEIHPTDQDLLRRALAAYPNARVVGEDGYRTLVAHAGAPRLLALVDPPFERPDDYQQAADALAAVLRANAAATVCVWLPLKDLETFDAFLRRVEASALVVEVRMRPLIDPMKMNGCALVIANPTPGLEEALRPACEWVVERLGEAGGKARIWHL
ncbi:MAG TPA: 23S rRNA (adenine(2030)-N(6))-methyltransferase RlmJ [Caulobacteraceae bacterium]